MPKKRDSRLFLEDMTEAIVNIKEYTGGMNYDEFIRDRKTKDAVLRNLEIIGEAAKNIPNEIKKKHLEINWKVVAGMRDKLIHEYFGVSDRIVWETTRNDILVLESQLKRILKKNGN